MKFLNGEEKIPAISTYYKKKLHDQKVNITIQKNAKKVCPTKCNKHKNAKKRNVPTKCEKN